ncbi:MAG: ribbon-helix-helix protein, CopG family [Solirubrobacteraceae bacterium]
MTSQRSDLHRRLRWRAHGRWRAGCPRPRHRACARSGQPITDAVIEVLAAEFEAGYDVDRLIARRPKRGRPALGSSAASHELVPLGPELREELLERARSEGATTSEIIREALRRFLHAA